MGNFTDRESSRKKHTPVEIISGRSRQSTPSDQVQFNTWIDRDIMQAIELRCLIKGTKKKILINEILREALKEEIRKNLDLTQ